LREDELHQELLRVHEAAFGWALHCARYDRTEAEDVLQQSYLKVLEGRATFGGRSAFPTWLFGVIRRTAGERRRSRTMRAMLLERWWSGEAASAGHAEDASAPLVRERETRELVDVIQRLSERQRDLLHLVFYQDMSIADAAAVMGLRLGTARTHYERGKARVRELLGERGIA
jgi:RNA polymerase sigma-70 factor (ECF subfamily)